MSQMDDDLAALDALEHAALERAALTAETYLTWLADDEAVERGGTWLVSMPVVFAAEMEHWRTIRTQNVAARTGLFVAAVPHSAPTTAQDGPETLGNESGGVSGDAITLTVQYDDGTTTSDTWEPT